MERRAIFGKNLEVLRVAGLLQSSAHGRIDQPIRHFGGPKRDLDGLDTQRAHPHPLAGPLVDAAQVRVGAKAAAGLVDIGKLDFGGDNGGRQRFRFGRGDGDPGSHGPQLDPCARRHDVPVVATGAGGGVGAGRGAGAGTPGGAGPGAAARPAAGAWPGVAQITTVPGLGKPNFSAANCSALRDPTTGLANPLPAGWTGGVEACAAADVAKAATANDASPLAAVSQRSLARARSRSRSSIERLRRSGRCKKVSRQRRSGRISRARCQGLMFEEADDERRGGAQRHHSDRNPHRPFETAACRPGGSVEPPRVDRDRCVDHPRHLPFAVAPLQVVDHFRFTSAALRLPRLFGDEV